MLLINWQFVKQVVKHVVKQGVVFRFSKLLVKYWLMIV